MEEEVIRERSRGTSTLTFVISKTAWWYLDVGMFYIRYTLVRLKLFLIFKKQQVVIWKNDYLKTFIHDSRKIKPNLEMKGNLKHLVGASCGGEWTTGTTPCCCSIYRGPVSPWWPGVGDSKIGSSSESEGANQGHGVARSVGHSDFKQGVQGHFLPCLEEKEGSIWAKNNERIHIWSLLRVALQERNTEVLISHSSGRRKRVSSLHP